MSVAEHGEFVHGIVLQVLEDLSVVRLLQQRLSGALQLKLGLVPGGTAHAAARAGHALDKVLGQTSDLQEGQGFLALRTAGALQELDVVDALASLLHALQDRVRDAAAGGEALAPDRGLLVLAFHRLHVHVSGQKQSMELAVSHRVIRVVRDRLVSGLGLFRDARSDEHGHAARMHGFQVSGDRAHGRYGGGHVLLILLREMLLQHVDEARAAGGGHLPAFFSRLRPLQGFIGGSHVSAEAHFHHVLEAEFNAGVLDGGHGDLFSELTFCGGRAHRIHFPSRLDGLDDVYQEGLRGDRAEGTVVDAVSAADAL